MDFQNVKPLLFIVVLPALIALLHSFGNYLSNGAFDFHARENMPRELASATLYMNEGYVEGGGVHGRVDQVYQRSDGALVVTDTKTRAKHAVYESDVVQVSAYAMSLRKSQPLKVCKHGYIRTVIVDGQGGRCVQYDRIKLMTDARVQALVLHG